MISYQEKVGSEYNQKIIPKKGSLSNHKKVGSISVTKKNDK